MKSRDCPFFAAVYCKCHLFRDAANRPLTPQRLLSAPPVLLFCLSFSSIVTGFSSFLLSGRVRQKSGDTLLSFPLSSRRSPKTSLSFSPHSPSLPSALKKRSIPDYRPRDLDRGRRTDEDGGESSREEMGGREGETMLFRLGPTFFQLMASSLHSTIRESCPRHPLSPSSVPYPFFPPRKLITFSLPRREQSPPLSRSLVRRRSDREIS